jgi:hypothetical protein
MPVPVEIAAAWEDWRARPFPRGVAGTQIDGVELVLLDADTAGAVIKVLRTWDSGEGVARDELVHYARTLEAVLPSMTGECESYFQALRSLVGTLLGGSA